MSSSDVTRSATITNARTVWLDGPARRYQLLVASDRLLLPDSVSELLGEPLCAVAQRAASAHLADRTMLVDESLRGAGELWIAQDAAAPLEPRTLADIVVPGARWLDCSVALQPLPGVDSWASSANTVNTAVSQFTERRIQARLDATLSLPPLSKTTTALLALRQRADADVAALVSLLEQDAALASRIVGWANSAHYAAPGNVDSIQDAIARVMGFEGAVNMALGLAVGQSVPSLPEHLVGDPPHWTEAWLTAAVMENLARSMSSQDCPVGLAYLAGLLGNMGTLLLGHVFVPQLERICELQRVNEHVHYGHCDLQILGLTRDILAAELLACWGLPEAVVVALRSQCLEDCQDALGALLGYSRSLLAQDGLSSFPVPPESLAVPASLQLEPDAVAATLAVIRDPDFELPSLASGC